MRVRRATTVAVLVAAVLAACASEEGAGPPERSAARAPVRTTSTTVPPRPTLERVVADGTSFVAPGDQVMHAVAADPAGAVAVAVGADGGLPAAWRATDPAVWQRVELGAVAPVARVHDVAASSSGGFVVVGEVDGRAAAWSSVDGSSWTPREMGPGPPVSRVVDTVVGLLAFGGEGGVVAVWRSFDGETWARAPDQPEVFHQPGVRGVAGVLEAGAAVVAVVDRADPGPEVWSSPDGLSWSPTPRDDDGQFAVPGSAVSARAVAELDDGTMVVAGRSTAADGVDAAAWTAVGARTWSPVPHDERVFGGDGAQEITTLAVEPGGRLVGLGTDQVSDDGSSDAAMWTSTDGAAWERADAEGLRTPGNQEVHDSAVLGGVVVAVGSEAVGGATDAAVWRVGAADAPPPPPAAAGPTLDWRRIDEPALAQPGEERLTGVAVTADGFVAAGAVRAPTGPVATGPSGAPEVTAVGDSDGAVWTSADGRAWDRADDAALAGPGDQEVRAVASGPGGIVAVGVDGEEGAVWRSAAGRRWERVADPDGIFGGPGRQAVDDVVAVAGGFLAVGVDGGVGEGDAAVWVSDDGDRWRRMQDAGLGGPGPQGMTGVAVGPDSVVAVGFDGGEAVAWSSADLVSWPSVSLGPGRAEAVDGLDGGVVAVGAIPDGDGGLDGVAWRLAGPAWERALQAPDLGGPATQELHGIALGPSTAVAVGHTDLGGGDDAATWASPDGSAWARTPHDEEVLGGDQAQRMLDVVVRDATAVAVGWTGTAPAGRDAVVWVADQIDVAGSARDL